MLDGLSIIIPSFNEEEYMNILLKDLQNEFYDYENVEILIVDDGSKHTLSDYVDINSYKVSVKIIRNIFNKGQTESIKIGIQHSKFSVIGLLDADGQNPPSELKKMYLLFLNEGIDAVVGFREKRNDKLIKKIPSKIANFLFRLLTKSKVKDLGCSLKILRKDHIDQLNLSGDLHRFIVPILEKRDISIKQVAVKHKQRTTGYSKYGLGRIIPVVVDSLLFYFTDGFKTSYRYVIGKVSFYFFLLGIIFSAVVLYQKYITEIFVHRNPLFLIAIFFFLTSIQIFTTVLRRHYR